VYQIQPVNDYILIEVEKAKEKTDSGIFIPDSAEIEKPQTAKVISVGPKVKNVKPGDTVLYSKYGATVVSVRKEEYYFIQQDDVVAIIRA